jgi:hypothetical protein
MAKYLVISQKKTTFAEEILKTGHVIIDYKFQHIY